MLAEVMAAPVREEVMDVSDGRDSGQGVCAEAHQGQVLAASLLTAAVEYISLMK